MRSMKFTRSKDEIVTTALWQKLNTFLIILINEFSEILANDLLLDKELVGVDIWNFKEHGCDHVNAFDSFPVKVKMWWSLKLPLISIIIKLFGALS